MILSLWDSRLIQLSLPWLKVTGDLISRGAAILARLNFRKIVWHHSNWSIRRSFPHYSSAVRSLEYKDDTINITKHVGLVPDQCFARVATTMEKWGGRAYQHCTLLVEHKQPARLRRVRSSAWLTWQWIEIISCEVLGERSVEIWLAALLWNEQGLRVNEN